MKLSIIYYSQTGHNYTMAKWAKEAAEAAGAEVRLVKVKELMDTAGAAANPGWSSYLEASKDVAEATSEDLTWADAILFSTPTRFGGMAFQMKAFLDAQGGTWAQGQLVDKVVSVMTSAMNPNGGQEASALSFYTSLAHWGAIIVPPGYTSDVIYKSGGNPYGTSGTATHEGFANDLEDAVKHQATRLVEVASRLQK